MTSQSITAGVHHVGLTVPNVIETAAFFVDVLGFKKVGARAGYPVIFVKDKVVVISLWQVQDAEAVVAFERKNTVGLHHLALVLDRDPGLDAIHARLLSKPEVEIEFSPEWLGSGPSRHMMCSIPGGIRLELIVPETWSENT